MQESLLQIVAASTFAIIAAALECHVNEASRRGWALPTQLHKGVTLGSLSACVCLPVCPYVCLCLSPVCCLSVCVWSLPVCKMANLKYIATWAVLVSCVNNYTITAVAGAAEQGQGMRVQGMWPYWLDGHAPTTVKNSFDMASMYLLTGILLPTVPPL